MKKRFLLLLVVILLFTSCGKNGVVLEKSAFDEEFRESDPSMFYALEHEHDIRYKFILDRKTPEADPISVYHRVYCYHENCDLEPYLEPHRINYFSPGKNTYLKENGYLYHKVLARCEDCHIIYSPTESTIFYIWALCNAQDKLCEGDCFDNVNWEEYICDMPYEILLD